jgi:hypothetical protein
MANIEDQDPSWALGERDDPVAEVEVEPDASVPGGRRAMIDPDDLPAPGGDPEEVTEQLPESGAADEDESLKPAIEADPDIIAEERREH